MHPPKPGYEERQPERGRPGEADQSAQFKREDEGGEYGEEGDQRDGSAPRYRLACRRHDLSEEAIGERK